MTKMTLRRAYRGGFEVGILCPTRGHWIWKTLTAKRKDGAEREAPGAVAELLNDAASVATTKADEFLALASSLTEDAGRVGTVPLEDRR